MPRHTVSFWNRVQFAPKLSAGLGLIHQAEMYATIDNTVTLPRFARVDVAVYYALAKGLRLQANVENLFDRPYYTNADSNTNISPGFPRAVRIGATTRF